MLKAQVVRPQWMFVFSGQHGLNRRISTHMCSADCVFLWCASSSLGCFPIYYLRNQNVFVHLGECLQLTPDTLVASVTVTRQEKTSSIKTVFFLGFKSSLAIIFCSTVVAFLGLKNTLEFIGYRRFFLVIIEASD